MDLEKEEQRQPLHPVPLSDDMSDLEYTPLSAEHSKKKSKVSWLLLLLTTALIGSNGFWLWQSGSNWHREPNFEPVHENYCQSTILETILIPPSFMIDMFLDNSTTTVLQPFHWITPFNSPDSNELWASLFPCKPIHTTS